MEISVKMESMTLDELAATTETVGKNTANELRIVLDKTAKKVASATKEPKGIKQRLSKMYAPRTFRSRDIAKLIRVHKASKTRLVAEVNLFATDQPGLHLFQPTATKKGVSYKITKAQGKKLATGAFQVKRYGEKVYKRMHKSQRGPFRLLRGISPYALYVKNDMQEEQAVTAAFQMQAQAKERMRFLLHKHYEKQAKASGGA